MMARQVERFVDHYRYVHPDGSIHWMAGTGRFMYDEVGRAIQMTGVVRVITDPVEADQVQRRRPAEPVLGEGEEWFWTLANSLPLLLWTCLPDGQCDFLSQQWLTYTGVPESAQLGYGWLDQVHPDDRARTKSNWETAVRDDSDFHCEFRIRRHDGQYRWFDTQAVRTRDAGGRTVKWFGFNTDINERKHAEEAQARLAAIVNSSDDAIVGKDT
jgi:PAS domain S-box-containing protein